MRATEYYFSYLTSGLVYSIHDLTPLQQGGCDFDGDISFSTDDPLVLKGSYDYSVAKPLFYDLTATDLVGRITTTNMIRADIRGLNSAVGKISNKGGSLYAKLQNYSQDSDEYQKIYESIVALGQVVGMEIDRIKTAVAPTMPLEWSLLQGQKHQSIDFEEIQMTTEEERIGISLHNELVPDLKPYYFRFNYEYIDKAIRDLDREFNRVCEYTFGFKLNELVDRCNEGLATDTEVQLFDQYRRAYPVIDSDCVVNHISHNFEMFEKKLKKNTVAEGENMLLQFVANNELDSNLVNQVSITLDEYKRFRRFLAKSVAMNHKESKNNKSKKTSETQNLISLFFRDKILGLVDGDLQLAFDLMVVVAKENSKIVWEIMDDLIVPIIKKGCTK